jgi:hypothetical protein
MRVERQLVTDLLRSRGNEKVAELAARSLPATIDLGKDRELLQECGIDPHVLAFVLNLSARQESVLPSAESVDGGSQRRAHVSDVSPGAGGRSRAVDAYASSCPRCAHRFSSADEMLDHLSSHHRPARSGQEFPAGPSMFLSAMPAWQVDAALSDLERSLRRPHASRLVRTMVRYAAVMVIVLAAVVLVVAGLPVLGGALAVSAVLLADGRAVRYLRKIHLGRGRGPGAE